MTVTFRSLCIVLALSLYGCGGGGGGGSSACSTLKVNGGESCESGAYPVVLLSMQKGDARYFCTGTAISRTAILTAAHCVADRPSQIEIATPQFGRFASSYSIHPQFRGVFASFDLAIIKVTDPMPVSPAPLLVSAGAPSPGAELVAYGYGVDENGRNALERATNGEAPLKATYLTFSSATNGYFYEAVSDGEGSTCKGDSGGPILAKNSRGEWGIIAVTSFSLAVSDTRQCIPIAPGAIAVVSPTQTDPAIAFIVANAPDAAVN